MKNYIQPGHTLEIAAAAAAIASGQVVIIGAHIVVANSPAAIGEPFNAQLSGVFELPKSTGVAFSQGQPLMWDASAAAFAAVGTPATGDVTAGGATAFEAAGSSASTAMVRLAGIPGTVA